MELFCKCAPQRRRRIMQGWHWVGRFRTQRFLSSNALWQLKKSQHLFVNEKRPKKLFTSNRIEKFARKIQFEISFSREWRKNDERRGGAARTGCGKSHLLMRMCSEELNSWEKKGKSRRQFFISVIRCGLFFVTKRKGFSLPFNSQHLSCLCGLLRPTLLNSRPRINMRTFRNQSLFLCPKKQKLCNKLFTKLNKTWMTKKSVEMNFGFAINLKQRTLRSTVET